MLAIVLVFALHLGRVGVRVRVRASLSIQLHFNHFVDANLRELIWPKTVRENQSIFRGLVLKLSDRSFVPA